MERRYVVQLTTEERAEFEALVRRGHAAAWKRTRAQALLLCDQSEQGLGWPDRRIVDALGVSVRSLQLWRKQAVERGPDSLLRRRVPALPPRRPKLDGEGEAQLVKLACSTPPSGRVRWTLKLLAERLVALEVVETICDETVRRALKKTYSSPGSISSGAFPRSRTRSLSAPWSRS